MFPTSSRLTDGYLTGRTSGTEQAQTARDELLKGPDHANNHRDVLPDHCYQSRDRPRHGREFLRAESDLYFASAVKKGGSGTLFHHREVTPIDDQTVIRMNRDTLYSAGVFDLDAGAVTITLPTPGNVSCHCR